MCVCVSGPETEALANKRSFNKRFNAKFTIVLFA